MASTLLPVNAGTLKWEVVDRFPLLGEQPFSELHAAWKQTSRALDRPASMHEFLLARMDTKSKDPTRLSFLIADPARLPPSAADTVRVKGPVQVKLTGPRRQDCKWEVSPWPSSQAIDSVACTLRIGVERDRPYEVRVSYGAGQSAHAKIVANDILIVAMGDSYSSGEGAPDRPAIYSSRFDANMLSNNAWFLEDQRLAPTPAVWQDDLCHRSLLSWQVQAALRLAFNHPHAVVRLLHTSCSGAEFFDKIFNAQFKSDTNGNGLEFDQQRARLTTYRDGDGKRSLPEQPGLYLQASQINAVRRVLCPWNPDSDDLIVPGFAYKAKWMQCPQPLPHMRPDALLLTVGGNDVRFSGAVGGILLPDTGRSPIGQLLLTAGRRAFGLISPDELTRNVQRIAPSYPRLVDAIAKGALTSTDSTVLLEYPNPIGPNTEKLANECYACPVQKRIKNAHLAFSVAAKKIIPFGWLTEWAVEFTPAEINEFTRHGFEELTTMIRSSCALTVPWNGSVSDDRGFTKRLLCTDQPDGSKANEFQKELEPVYFCQISKGKRVDGCRAKPLVDWNSETAGRRIVNSSNDSVLAQRTYGAKPPSKGALIKALAGTFHPTPEAYAVAADSAYESLCRVLSRRGMCKTRSGAEQPVD